MKTKTLLIAAAALAATVISSQAQVYSGIVGYASLNFTNGVIAAVAPTLDYDGTGTNNTISTIFTAPAVNDSVFIFNPSGGSYDNIIYKKTGHSPNFVTNWTLGATITNNYAINPGEGLFYLPAANETNVIVGNVLQSSNLVNGYVQSAGVINLLSSVAPISGGLTTVLGYQPNVNDSVFLFNGAGYDNYIYKKTGHSPNFVTNWTFGATAIEPVINSGQGFWLLPAATTTWTENFVAH